MSVESLSSSGYSPLDLERLVVAVNPVATNAGKWEQYADDFGNIPKFRRRHVITTEPKAEDTVDKLANELQDGDLLYVWSGDGGTNDVIQYLGQADAPAVGLMASEAGDARNFRKATIHNIWDGRPSEALRRGEFAAAYPMRLIVEGPESYTDLALTVAGIGAMAAGAYLLDAPEHRNHPLRQNPHTRLLYQKYLALKTLPHIHELQLSDAHEQPMTAAEVMAVNAPDIAKEFKFDTQIDAPDFLVGIIRSAGTYHLIKAINKMRHGKLPVRRISNNAESVSFQLTDVAANQQAYIHVDGKARLLAPGSRVTIGQVRQRDATHRPISTVTARRAA